MKLKILALFLMLPFAVYAANSKISVQENVDYKVVKPKLTLPHHNNKLNVTEFFSYHCGHCLVLEPYLEAWKKSHPNVDFNQIQVVWGNYFKAYAKINATINIMNKPELNNIIFKAVQVEGKNLEDEKVLREVLKANLNKSDFNNFMGIMNSFSVSTKPSEYKKYSEAFEVTETPLIIIDNQYIIAPAEPDKLMAVMDAIVATAAHERGLLAATRH